MKESGKTQDFTSLVRLPVLVVCTVVYNLVTLVLLWRTSFSYAAITGIVISILVTLLLLRYSRRLACWLLKPGVSRENLNRLLLVPLVIWWAFSITALVPWVFLWIRG